MTRLLVLYYLEADVLYILRHDNTCAQWLSATSEGIHHLNGTTNTSLSVINLNVHLIVSSWGKPSEKLGKNYSFEGHARRTCTLILYTVNYIWSHFRTKITYYHRLISNLRYQ